MPEKDLFEKLWYTTDEVKEEKKNSFWNGIAVMGTLNIILVTCLYLAGFFEAHKLPVWLCRMVSPYL